MRIGRLIIMLFLGLALLSCAKAGTYPLYLRYNPAKELPSLQQKIGTTLALAPFRDERRETLFIGIHTPFHGSSSRYKSDPSPLERAIQESLSGPLSRHKVRTVPISSWDGSPESLKKIDADSVLMIEIKKFWTEAQGDLLKTVAKTSIQLSLHLGVKKEGKVFTRNVEVEKETTAVRLTSEDLEKAINQTLTEIFDSFFANPY
ncbi:MAG: hypothetical protein A2170_15440 [Deltaproteobacteria bacterium RBG_13_53_10]|nr:MAG: hypothetical protein A2170_15440 [Deltaproteobacteria bacterium RBG_13_53_10]